MADLKTSGSQASLQPYVAVTPSDTITFSLVRNTSPKTVLKVTNVSNGKVAFKIKTTQPSWYYVRPNQQILDVDQSEEVTIVLVDVECNRYLDQLAVDQADKQLEKHRFLVQSKSIDDSTFDKISALSHNNRTDEYNRIWDSGKDDRKNQKLKVEFIIPESSGTTKDERDSSAPLSVSEQMEVVRKRLPKSESSGTTSILPIPENIASNPDLLFAELQNLRKKYDAVVEYTVHLTAERDFHFTQLEEMRRDLNKEKSRGKSSPNSSASVATRTSKSNNNNGEKVTSTAGFSFFVLIFVGLIAFLLGRYFHN